MSTLQGNWIWYELMTGDAAGSKAFYEAVVGWRITLGTEPPMHYGMIANADGEHTGGIMPLTAEMTEGGAYPGWLGYIGVDDCDAAISALEAKGGKVMMPAFDVEDVGRIAMVADPNGAPYYIMTPIMPDGYEGGSTAFSREKMGRCSWNELRAGDQAKALAYYPALYGWTLPEPMDMGAMGKYQFIEHDGVVTGAIMQKPAQMPMGGWAFFFRVADIDAAVATVKDNGGQVMQGPHEVPGGERIIVGLDPQGATFGLVAGASTFKPGA